MGIHPDPATDTVELTIAAMDGASFSVRVPRDGVVSDVKRACAQHGGEAEDAAAAAHAAQLFVAGTENPLPDAGPLADLGITNATTLFMLTYAPPHLDAQTTVRFTPFASDLRPAVVEHVLEAARGTIIYGVALNGLCRNHSLEGGFEMPLTADWRRAVRTQNPRHAQYLKYHGARQFRFNAAPQIDSLYTKDSMRWWTTAEKEGLRLCMEAAIAATTQHLFTRDSLNPAT